MALLDDATIEEGFGRWFPFGKDPETGDVVEFDIELIPEDELRQIHRRHFGKEQHVKHVKGVPVTSYNTEQSHDAAIDKAVRALRGARHFRLKPSASTAERYQELLKLPEPPKVGEPILLDQKLSREWRELKEFLLAHRDALVTWIIEKHDSMRLKAAEDEEALKS